MTIPDRFAFIVLTPGGGPSASLAIAASRAGALGVLNLEFAGEAAAAVAALGELARHARRDFGVLIDGRDEPLLGTILEAADESLSTVLLSRVPAGDLSRLAALVQRAGRKLFLVVSSLQEALAAQEVGADAVIAKGQEAGGWVGEETTFVLLQHLRGRVSLPVFAQGGVGMHTAAACYLAGAAGAVLDSQLLLARESPLSERARARVAAMDGSETAVVGSSLGAGFRAYARPDLPLMDELRRFEASEELLELPEPAREARWREALRPRVDWSGETGLWAIGQDASFAAGLARRFRTVGGIIAALQASIEGHLRDAAGQRALAPDSELARSHATPYPIVQGPMTRVSDRAAFADAVSRGGALPFLALALMRGEEIRALLAETSSLLAGRSWGVGILGFVPADLRAEQLEIVREFRPPFALIAGGRPDQARVLEKEGIPTYLHVPSPGLLSMFLEEGARRFVFEGRECGGHIGPRTSFVLWETMVEVLLRFLDGRGDGAEFHVLFAGGIQDGLSAAMVAAMAAPLVGRGVRIGVLMGTAYLFTAEAVESGAIQEGFQRAALACDQTVILEATPGYATRCLPSPFVETFNQEKRRLLRSGVPPEQLKDQLENLNIGRLRVASKGVDHNPLYESRPGEQRLIEVPAEEQWRRGMYMIGQVAALREGVCSIKELHSQVCDGGDALLAAAGLPLEREEPAPPPAAVAIVGMASIVPGAGDLRTFWSNILNKVDSVGEVPPQRWDPEHYYDPERSAPDKVYSRWGGFIEEVPFDPLEFGMPPNSLLSIEPFQLLGLAVVRDALKDAGYLDRPFPRERTSVVLGAGGGAPDLTAGYVVRSSLPSLFGDMAPKLTEHLKGVLPEWTEDSFAGLLMNVAAGRIANRFDFGGVNYTVDAACASSLAAIYLAVRDLEARTSDVVVAGGIDAIQNPFAFLCFSKTQALSPSGRSRPFDEESDGIAISEGFAAIVLKRLEDAERDGDRIYAVIRGVGGSSDGRDRGLTAPRPEGQVRAFQRAYAQARFSPASVELVEAHGTGTVAGDQAEVQSLTRIFAEAGAPLQGTAIGSVKSMIGHTKATAGVAGLIKVAKALHHRVLPPTLGVQKPNTRANFAESPFYVNTEARPWVKAAGSAPRRAGVSAFGFGGTNFHILLEEYTGDFLPEAEAALDPWPAELFLWQAASRAELRSAVEGLRAQLAGGARPRPADLAFSLAQQAENAPSGGFRLAVVAGSIEQLTERLEQARALLDSEARDAHTPQGIHFSERPLARAGKVAFLFPGQGSQTVNMLRELAIAFPEVRGVFDTADAVLAGRLPKPLSRYVFPPPAFTPEEEKQQQNALTETDVAQPALGVAGLAVTRLLRSFGVEPEMTAGHSYGEFVALQVAGAMDEKTLLELSEARGRFMKEGAGEDSGSMAAVSAPPEALAGLREVADVTLANLNSPRQTVISGATAEIDKAVAWCEAQGITARKLVVACAFHSPLVAPAQQKLARTLAAAAIRTPRVAAYSNTTAARYPDEPSAIVAQLAEHLARPVEFVRQVEAMYADGARIFIEAGPRQVLSGLVGQILGERPHVCVPIDVPGRPGLQQFLNALASLLSEGVDVRLERLFRGRQVQRLDLSRLDAQTGAPSYSPTTWMVSGGGVRPLHGGRERARLPLRIALLDDPAAAPAQASLPAHPASAASTNGTVPLQPVAPPGPEAEAAASVAAQPAAAAAPEPSAAPPQAIPAVAAPATGGVMEHFQQVMRRFLEVQENVMLELLRPGAAAAATPQLLQAAEPLQQPPPAALAPSGSDPRIAPAPGDARTHEEETAPAPALAVVPAPGNDSTAAGAHPRLPPREQILQRLLAIVSDRTGYPAELLSPAADLEADLGVDSIKRVEIVGAALRELSESFTRQPEVELLTACRTLDQLAGQLELLLAPDQHQVPARPAGGPLPGEDQAAAAAPSREQISELLLSILADRTGYPRESLPLTADFEADLGIDSIKRVEVVGSALRELQAYFAQPPELERLTACRTLQQLTDTITAALEQTPAAPPSTTAAAARERPAVTSESAPATIGRYLPRAVPAPPAARDAGLDRSGVVVILDDSQGAGESLTRLLQAEGLRAVRVVPASFPAADGLLAAREDAEALVDELHGRYGHACALVDLTPLGAEARGGESPTAGLDRAAETAARFLALVKALRSDLKAATAAGGACVLGVTRMGGCFGFDAGRRELDLSHAWLPGFVKTLYWEWPDIRARAVDLEWDAPEKLAERVLAELLTAGGLLEAGYRRDGVRLTLKLQQQPLSPADTPLPLGGESVLLVTGGARGITAETALALARQYRPTLVLVGRTPPPADAEPADTAGLSEERELKKALFERLRRDGSAPRPPEIEAAYRALLREREVREVLRRYEATGARAVYLSCDVRDAGAFGALIDSVYERFGRLDGVLHGAGLIEDRLLADKTEESFRRVFETKVNSAATLAARLRPDGLRFLVFFSSVSGRFGNRGQADYAAANEALNKLALRLDAAWPGRVVAIDWGPWQAKGMVSAEAERQFAERGLSLIPVETGCRMLLEELAGAASGGEIVIAGLGEAAAALMLPPGETSAPAPVARTPAAARNGHGSGTPSGPLPLLEGGVAEFSRGPAGEVEVVRLFTQSHDLYLQDHILDDKPVVPFAVVMELVAEVAKRGWPQLELLEIREVRALNGIVLEGAGDEVRVTAVPRPAEANGHGAGVVLDVAVRQATGRQALHYRATVEMGRTTGPRSNGVSRRPLNLEQARPLEMSVADFYSQWLFHGPRFQVIDSLLSLEPEGAFGLLKPTSPRDYLAGSPEGAWVIDPIVLDAAFQMQVLWVRQNWAMTALPSSVQSLRPLDSLSAAPGLIACELRIRKETSAPISHTDFVFRDAAGHVLVELSDLEGIASKALNRLPESYRQRGR